MAAMADGGARGTGRNRALRRPQRRRRDGGAIVARILPVIVLAMPLVALSTRGGQQWRDVASAVPLDGDSGEWMGPLRGQAVQSQQGRPRHATWKARLLRTRGGHMRSRGSSLSDCDGSHHSLRLLLERLNLTRDSFEPPSHYNSACGDLPNATRLMQPYGTLAREKLLAARQSNSVKNPTKAIADATQGLHAFHAAVESGDTSEISNQTIAELLCERGTAYSAYAEWHLSLADFSLATKILHRKMNRAYFSTGMCMSALERYDEAMDHWMTLLQLNDTEYHKLAVYWMARTNTSRNYVTFSKIAKTELETIAFCRTHTQLAIQEKNYTAALEYMNTMLGTFGSMIGKLPSDQAQDAQKLAILLEDTRTMLRSYMQTKRNHYSSELAFTATRAMATSHQLLQALQHNQSINLEAVYAKQPDGTHRQHRKKRYQLLS